MKTWEPKNLGFYDQHLVCHKGCYSETTELTFNRQMWHCQIILLSLYTCAWLWYFTSCLTPFTSRPVSLSKNSMSLVPFSAFISRRAMSSGKWADGRDVCFDATGRPACDVILPSRKASLWLWPASFCCKSVVSAYNCVYPWYCIGNEPLWTPHPLISDTTTTCSVHCTQLVLHLLLQVKNIG